MFTLQVKFKTPAPLWARAVGKRTTSIRADRLTGARRTERDSGNVCSVGAEEGIAESEEGEKIQLVDRPSPSFTPLS